MGKRILEIAMVGAAAIIAAACCSMQPEQEYRISWDRSSFNCLTEMPVPAEGYIERNLYYPRIKRVADGGLLLSFMDDHYGWNVFTCRSEDDGRTWGPVTKVRACHPGVSTLGEDEVVYVNPDFLQLKDGRIMLAWQWRYRKGYGDLPNTNMNCGIEIAFSNDGGRTWGEPREVYRGRCWEPAMLELPSGEIHMYLTDSQKIEQNMSCPKTSLIRSFDGGETWQGKPCCTWEDVEGISYTRDSRFGYDGMATAVLLDDGSIAMSIEVWSGKYVVDQTPVVVKTPSNWHDVDQETLLKDGGPAYPLKKQVNKDMVGYGPYIGRLPGGQVLVLTNGQYRGEQGVWVLEGDGKADNFTHGTSPFQGYWGSIDYIGNGKVIATGTERYRDAGELRGRVNYITGRINYGKCLKKNDLPELLAPEAYDRDNPDSWFLGARDSAVSTFYDFGYSADGFTLRSHVYTDKISSFTLENSDASVIQIGRGKEVYKLATGPSGEWKLFELDNCSWHETASGETSEIIVTGTVNDDGDADTGFASSVTVAWKLLGGTPRSGEVFRIHPARWIKTASKEKAARLWEEPQGENPDLPSDWLPVVLK